MQETVKGLIDKKLINAAHDCADGGLFTTLIEMSIPNKLGFDIVKEAILYPIKQIANNAGFKGDGVVEKVKDDTNFNNGFNASINFPLKLGKKCLKKISILIFLSTKTVL